MDKSSRIVIIGAGVFGLSAAQWLASEGHQNVLVLDRHVPPVPDGSSNDISRVIRFDYADEDYLDISREAYLKWRDYPKYRGIFYPTDYVLASNHNSYGRAWIEKTTAALTSRQLPWTKLEDAEAARRKFPILTGQLANPEFTGYHNHHGGWADAAKGVSLIRDECLQLGVSFVCGKAGTVVGFDTDSDNSIKAVKTMGGTPVAGDVFILTAGAWTPSLVPMYNSALSTAQVLGYIHLTPDEMHKYRDLPIYANFATGWFNFPPHDDTQTLKIAVHGWGYTRTPEHGDLRGVRDNTSSPPLPTRRQRANFAPAEAERRLREGLREMLPELADRPFQKLALCWYTDTPTGDFIMDFHADHKNLFIGGGCSGHAFKFLPVLGKYLSQAIKGELPPHLATKWRFRTDYQGRADAFEGDGSRGGPERRVLSHQESAQL